MKSLRVFIASSNDLKTEREKLELFLHRLEYIPTVWENIDNSITNEKFQDRINNSHLIKSDIVLFIIKSKLGKYTLGEFEKSYENLDKNIKKVFIYFIDFDKNEIDNKELRKIINLQGFLEDNGHIYHEVDDYLELEHHFQNQLRIMEDDILSEIIEKKDMNRNKILENEKPFNLKFNNSLPLKDLNFVDRPDDIKEIIRKIITNGKCLVYGIRGIGGIGKSAIVTEICHIFLGNSKRDYLGDTLEDKKYFTDGILWIRFEKDKSFDKYINDITRSLGYENFEYKNIYDLSSKFYEIFYEKDVLIVLDSVEQNIESCREIYNLFVNILPIIATSRKEVDFIQHQEIGLLSLEKSIKLFSEYCNISNITLDEKETVSDICKYVGQLPLGIKIVATWAQTFGPAYIKNLIENNKFMSIDSENELENILEFSYIEMLSDFEQKIFAITSIYNSSFSSDMLKHTLGQDVHKVVHKLVSLQLLNKTDNDLYSLHPMIREFLYKKFEKLSENKNFKKAKAEYFLNLIESDSKKIKEHFNEIIYILNNCKNDEIYVKYVKILDYWLHDYGYWDYREEFLKVAIYRSIDDDSKYNFKVSLGDLYSRLGENEKSVIELEESLEYFSIDKNVNKNLFIQYSLNTIYLNRNEFKRSYILNNQLQRESLHYSSNNWYRSSIRTNGWIAKEYYNKDLSINFCILRLIYQLQDVDDVSMLYCFEDMINILFDFEEYEKAEKIIKTIMSKFEEYLEYSSLKLSLINISLENKVKNLDLNLINELKVIKQNYSLSKNKIDSISLIEGKIELYKYKNISKAKQCFQKIEKEHVKNYWLGRCELEDENFNMAKQYFQKAKEFYILNKNTFMIASVDIYLGFIESKINIQNASNIFSRCKKVFDEFNFVPKEYYSLVKNINNLGINEDLETIERSDFFLYDLPKVISLDDKKEMILIPKGKGFYSAGSQEFLTIDCLVNNIEDIVENSHECYKKYKDNYVLYDFYIDKECVTNAEYISFCEDIGKTIPVEINDIDSTQLNESITGLSVNEAKEYAEYYGKVLPLPEEWEIAARGENGYLYPWGNEWDDDFIPNEVLLNQERCKDFFIFLFSELNTYKELLEWIDSESLVNNNIDLDDSIFLFSDEVSVNKIYFIRLLLLSFSLNTYEKYRVVEFLPILSQFQIDELIKVWEDEIKKFKELYKEHPFDVEILFKKAKDDAMDFISFNLNKNIDLNLEINCNNGLKNITGNHYEITVNNENILLKGGLLTQYNAKEKLKLNSFILEQVKRNSTSLSSLTSFRCVKPIFSRNDIENIG